MTAIVHNKFIATRLAKPADFGGLHPTMIAAHIAAVSNVQKSPRKSPIYWRFWRRLLAGFAR